MCECHCQSANRRSQGKRHHRAFLQGGLRRARGTGEKQKKQRKGVLSTLKKKKKVTQDSTGNKGPRQGQEGGARAQAARARPEAGRYLGQADLAHGVQPLDHVVRVSEVEAGRLEETKGR